MISKYVSVDGPDSSYRVWLNVGNQHFPVGPYWDSREEAEWYASMLTKAIEGLVRDTQRTVSPGRCQSHQGL